MDNILSAEQSTISSQDLPKYGYVYLTTNLINNKKYVGVHKSSCFDEFYKGSGKILRRAFEKYGWENFKTEIIKWCYSKEELFNEEFLEINRRDALNSEEYYNIMPGGHGGDNKTSLSPKEHELFIQRIKKSKDRPRTDKEIAHMKKMHEMQKGRPRSEETINKIRNSNLGQTRSEEARKHMSESHADVSGDKNPMYGVHLVLSEEQKKEISKRTRGELNPMYGKSHSEESKKKMSESHMGITKGKIWMTNKVDIETMVRPEEYEDYINSGYVRGRLRKSQKLKLGR